MTLLEKPSRVVVISDLHMAAANGRGSFSAHDALRRFIKYLDDTSRERLDLVVLGDALDFLQVEPFLAFDEKSAVTKLQQILDNPDNQLVFAALRSFNQPGRLIRWCIGNHDVELIFPAVRNALHKVLYNDNDPGAAARVQFHLDGEPLDYALTEQPYLLRLIHGNQHDAWNSFDYAAATDDVQRGISPRYPLGSRLVAQVLNALHDDGFVFIDRLKPEVPVAVLLALALWPKETMRHLRTLFPMLGAAQVAYFLRFIRHLIEGRPPSFAESSEHEADPRVDPESELLARALCAGVPIPKPVSSVDTSCLVESAQHLSSGEIERWVSNLSLALESEEGAEQLARALAETKKDDGTFGILSWAKELSEYLLRTIADYTNRHSELWAIESRDELDPYAEEALKGNIAVLVAGHTHLAKAISYPTGFYLNTGTWAELMRIPSAFHGREFQQHARELKDYFAHPGTAPDSLRTFRRLTYADIRLVPVDGRPYRAMLCEWCPEPDRKLLGFPP